MGFCRSSPRSALFLMIIFVRSFAFRKTYQMHQITAYILRTACYFIVVKKKIIVLIHIFKFPTCPEYRILSYFLPSYGKRFQQLVGDLRPKGWLDAFKPEKKTHFWRGRTFKFEMTVLCLDHLMILFFLL